MTIIIAMPTFIIIMPKTKRTTIATYIALTTEEYRELRYQSLKEGVALAELLARLARSYLKRSTRTATAVQHNDDIPS